MESLVTAPVLPAPAPSDQSARNGLTSPAVKRGTDKSDEFSSVLSKKLESVRKEAESDYESEMLSMLTASALGPLQQKTENVEPPEVEGINLTHDAVETMLSSGQDGAQAPAFPAEFPPAIPLTLSALQPSSAESTMISLAESVPDPLNAGASSSMAPAVNDSPMRLQALDDMARELLSSGTGAREADHRFNMILAEALQKEAAVSSETAGIPAAGVSAAAAAKSSSVLPSIVKAIEYRPQQGVEISSLLLQKLDEAVSRLSVIKSNNNITESRQPRSEGPAVSGASVSASAGDAAESLLLAEHAGVFRVEQQSAEGEEFLSTQTLNSEAISGEGETGETVLRPLHENLTRELTGNIRENRALQEPNLRVQISDLIRQVSGAADSSRPEELVNVKLDPPTLGEVSVRVAIENSRMNVQFSVSDRSVKSLIEDNLHSLVQQCADKGIALGGFSVECRQGRNSQDYTPSNNTKGSDDEPEEMESFKSVLPEHISTLVNVRV